MCANVCKIPPKKQKWPLGARPLKRDRAYLHAGAGIQGGHDNFSTYCEFVVTQRQLTVFKAEWQRRQLRAAVGSRGP